MTAHIKGSIFYSMITAGAYYNSAVGECILGGADLLFGKLIQHREYFSLDDVNILSVGGF